MKVPTTCETDGQEVRLEEHQKSIKRVWIKNVNYMHLPVL